MKKCLIFCIFVSLFVAIFASSSSYYSQDLAYELKKMSSILYMSDYYAELEQWENKYEYPLKNAVNKDEWDNVSQSKAVSILWDYAQEGILTAQCLLARCFFSGVGTPLDAEQAFYWFSKAAFQGYAPAWYGLARCYELGYGVNIDTDIANKFYERAANAKYAPALSSYAFIKDDVDILIEAANQNYAYALRVLGDYFSSSKDKEEQKKAVSYYEKGFELQESDCAESLATIYADGVLVDSDSSLSANYYYAYLQMLHEELIERNDILNADYDTFLARAKSNNKWACDRIARVYKIGTDKIMPDLEQAVYWTRKSAEAGNIDSCVKLGDWYFSTDLGYPNYTEALYWYKKAYKGDIGQNKAHVEEMLDEIYHNSLGLNFMHNALFNSNSMVDFDIADYKDIQKEEAENWIKKRAKENSNGNVFLLAGMLFGTTDKETYDMCIELLKKTIDNGFYPAWYELGLCYEKWFNAENDVKSALECYENILAEDLNSFIDEEIVAYVFSTYNHVYAIYSNESSEFVNKERAEELKVAISQMQTRIDQIQNDNTEKNHFLSVEKNALDGDVESFVTLGDFYVTGYGCKLDYQKALYWYEKAANENNPDGLYKLALSYETGKIRKADYNLLFKYLQKAAEAGNSLAMVRLGELYETGERLKFDTIQSFYWFEKALNSGNSDMQKKLNSYQGISSIEKDWLDLVMDKYQWDEENLEASYNRILEGANQDDPDAQYIIGYCYFSGIYVEPDLDIAKEWFTKSASNGNEESKKIIDDWESIVASQRNPLDDYNWDDSDEEGSVQRVLQAAEQGDAQAQYILGFCYLEGRGVEKDVDVAHSWFEKAANNGYSEANDILAQWDEVLYGM